MIEGRNTGFPNALAALEKNGSDRFKIEMNPERDYVSVIIPVHSYFLKSSDSKAEKYYEKILEILKDRELTLTEISTAMDYKGITKKLRNSLEYLCETGSVERIASGSDIRYRNIIVK